MSQKTINPERPNKQATLQATKEIIYWFFMRLGTPHTHSQFGWRKRY